jgi:hypothetical protein
VVVCVAPANLTDQIEQLLSFDAYASTSTLYVSIKNDMGATVYGLLQPLPSGKTSCVDASGRSSTFKISDSTQQNFKINDDPSHPKYDAICMVLGKTAEPGYSSFSHACAVHAKKLTKLSDASFAGCYVN